MMKLYNCIIISIFLTIIDALDLCSNATESEVCYLEPNYDINKAPNSNGSPTEVEIGIYFYDIIEQSDEKRSLTVSIGFETYWTDHRISVKNFTK